MIIDKGNDRGGDSVEKILCEYHLFVELSRCSSIEALNAALEKIFQELFDAKGNCVLNPSSTQIAGMEENIRNVVIDEPRDSPRRRFVDAILEVYENNYELLEKSQIDKLTGLYNRQLLDEKIRRLSVGKEVSDRRKNEPERIVVIFDIDHFKSINDRFGHLYGDEVLVIISHLMKQAFRTDDWLFRYGGEEFLVFLNNLDVQMGRIAINRFINQVEAHSFPQIGKVTISAGYTSYDPAKNFSVIFDQADKALYYSKEHGRNQSHMYEDLSASNKLNPATIESDIDLF